LAIDSLRFWYALPIVLVILQKWRQWKYILFWASRRQGS